MSSGLIFQNVVAYSLQIGMLVGLAAFVPAVLRLRQPGAKLVYWQILLAACVLLPLQPWRQAVVSGTVEVTTVITAVRTVHQPAPGSAMPPSEMALAAVLAGMAIRLGWLAVGFWKLRRYRRHSRPLEPAQAWSVEASLRISGEVASPVTFGWRRPVVLLPAAFPAMDGRVQEAILCHEVMHVRRRDWVFTVVEELVRAVFWFHPAIWWLLGEIGLAREQEVDRLAIEITREREHYMDALLAIAGGRAGLDLAPAPLFLRKRHLKHRVVLILQEARMSKTRLISALAAGLGILAAACWLAMGAFPLTAEPQVVNDAPGVTVSMNGSTVLHRASVNYPPAALARGIEGTVSVEVKLDASGNVSDARVLSGPDELRKAALESVLQWHFTRDAAGSTRVVGIAFQAPQPGAVEQVAPAAGGSAPFYRVGGGVVGPVPATGGAVGGVPTVRSGVLGGIVGSVPAGAQSSSPPRIKSITVSDALSEQARQELLASLPVHEGDEFNNETMQRVTQAVRAFDEHLSGRWQIARTPSGELQMGLSISPGPDSPDRNVSSLRQSPAVTPSVGAGSPVERIKVGANVQAMMIVSKAPAVYPELAKAARVQGVVHLAAVIAKDGTVQELHSLGGPALLIQSAMDAVRQWVYKPTLLNGQPVTVETTIDVNYTLNQ